ncbi:hypothetical protein RY27_16855 [Litorilinea aerophila]|nr:hypothetical protein RY27_16855 [Litorilinea aerophila]
MAKVAGPQLFQVCHMWRRPVRVTATWGGWMNGVGVAVGAGVQVGVGGRAVGVAVPVGVAVGANTTWGGRVGVNVHVGTGSTGPA